eukprot:6244621-Lingulodinium_polyedra.AAC.1
MLKFKNHLTIGDSGYPDAAAALAACERAPRPHGAGRGLCPSCTGARGPPPSPPPGPAAPAGADHGLTLCCTGARGPLRREPGQPRPGGVRCTDPPGAALRDRAHSEPRLTARCRRAAGDAGAHSRF